MAALIFEPSVQADVTLARPHVGTGLGVTIGSHLIGLQGASLAVASKAGGGTIATARFARTAKARHVGA